MTTDKAVSEWEAKAKQFAEIACLTAREVIRDLVAFEDWDRLQQHKSYSGPLEGIREWSESLRAESKDMHDKQRAAMDRARKIAGEAG